MTEIAEVKMAEVKMADLRARAKEAGIKVPVGTSKAALVQMLETAASDAADDAAATDGRTAERPRDDQPQAAPPKAQAVEGVEHRKIEHISERGDWLDPFSGKTIYYGDEESPASGARREGDEAVLSTREVERLASR